MMDFAVVLVASYRGQLFALALSSVCEELVLDLPAGLLLTRALMRSSCCVTSTLLTLTQAYVLKQATRHAALLFLPQD
jgi:hypothetical protein